ncbi:MAG: DNA repair protein RecN, partial [Odoribacter sp.]|nr:DNA repair protein RecN [Odoribacter sp.]
IKEYIVNKLNGIQGYEEKIAGLETEIKQLEEEMQDFSQKIHTIRVEASVGLCERMKELLMELGIKHADFRVSVKETEDFTPTGKDEVKFLFSANKNQLPGDIEKVASGGEISRVMLSLKYILSKVKQLPVIVFDEIDTGLSGEVAHKMAIMMNEMANYMQVMSISHLPQIASMGGSHFKVYKEDAEHKTVSRIRELNYEERVKEIAGMISGSHITEAAIETARNLLSK